ncbi:hypothetical protein CYQ88_02330 [Hydrogenovibrio sp. SC-1]|uniref:hypothetical protein n=1 Tax=Hydrogenovibrio sp. SC-1 TaxID=2065820 RepID=UPI000CBF65FF|nr:hypothetical protein [Hydrogenovibrio sp. SC-1]PLA75087.1 hypothetical protein CYQ88_02330 [Hydrogenovibrio sp. SC-1]
MNQLPFPVRPAAKEVFLYQSLADAIMLKKGKVSRDLSIRYQLDQAQWRMVADAVILARLPQYRLLNYFDIELLVFLELLFLDALNMPGFSSEEAVKQIERDAQTLASWVRHLQKLISRSKLKRLNGNSAN